MTEHRFNPDDLRALMSRNVDDDLTEPERRGLEDALRAEPALAREASQFQAVNRLLKLWAEEPLEIDWQEHLHQILSRVAEDNTDADLTKVDALLRSSEVHHPGGELFVEEVLARMTRPVGRRIVAPWLLRVAAPLAAAAAITLAVLVPWRSETDARISIISFAPTVVETRGTVVAGPASRVVVFGRDAVALGSAATGTGFLAVGSDPDLEEAEGLPPL